MTRNEALEKFREENRFAREQIKEQFWNHAEEQAEAFASILKQVFCSIRKDIEASEKEKMMFLYFSLLRTDVLNREYHILVQVFDARWYMDTEPISFTFSLDFLFEVFHPFWDQCLEDSRKYIGKINRYDVGNMIQELVMECNSMLAGQLRFMLRDIEQNKDFMDTPKEDAWTIRWGEYRDNSEIIACVDRVPKTQREWERSVRKTDSREDELVAGYWYKTDLKGSQCRDRLLYFINFEDCTLTDVIFDGSNLTGARFRNCTLSNCSFQGAVLRQVDFDGCTLQDNLFDGADMTNAVFTEEELSQLTLNPEQETVVFVEERGKNA